MVHGDFKNVGSPSIRTMEECSELIKAICKAERFGYFKVDPLLLKEDQISNRIAILREIADVTRCLYYLQLFLERMIEGVDTDS